MLHDVGEDHTNARRSSMATSTGGLTPIAPKLLIATPVAIVLPSGTPASVRRWMSTVTGPCSEQDRLNDPTPVSLPAAAIVNVCAILRPFGPPNEIEDWVWVPPCCSRADTRHVSVRVMLTGGLAASVT